MSFIDYHNEKKTGNNSTKTRIKVAEKPCVLIFIVSVVLVLVLLGFTDEAMTIIGLLR